MEDCIEDAPDDAPVDAPVVPSDGMMPWAFKNRFHSFKLASTKPGRGGDDVMFSGFWHGKRRGSKVIIIGRLDRIYPC